ncbi:hypothetical protein EUX98_g2558 [Antrodiella citrinella]|uniref:Terpene synthase n=1 Tax=Antrodiella citrinella TaxID=2447956 RepID=A0A4S4N044_9APHY|nr:hypothetical protein EUX98_g2558 [Antrodiella citrinella]
MFQRSWPHPHNLLQQTRRTNTIFEMTITMAIQQPTITHATLARLSPEAPRTREILLDLFKRTGISNDFHWNGMDLHVKKKALEIAKSWDLGLSDRDLDKYLTVGLVIAISGYSHTPIETQIAVALYTLCCTAADDNVMSNEILREFAPRFFDGREQLHPILTHLVEELIVIRQQYSTFSGNAVTISTMDFFSAEMFLRDEGGSDLRVREATEYVDYVRWKTGVGEAYAALIWPQAMFPETKTYIQAMPDAIKFICLLNDVMSFYKEAKAGETDNYVTQYGVVCGQSAIETLEGLVERLVELDGRIKAVLGSTPEQRAWELFAAGYAEFHLYTPRYFLKDLLPEYY